MHSWRPAPTAVPRRPAPTATARRPAPTATVVTPRGAWDARDVGSTFPGVDYSSWASCFVAFNAMLFS